jgi:hypothetical protein
MGSSATATSETSATTRPRLLRETCRYCRRCAWVWRCDNARVHLINDGASKPGGGALKRNRPLSPLSTSTSAPRRTSVNDELDCVAVPLPGSRRASRAKARGRRKKRCRGRGRRCARAAARAGAKRSDRRSPARRACAKQSARPSTSRTTASASTCSTWELAAERLRIRPQPRQ